MRIVPGGKARPSALFKARRLFSYAGMGEGGPLRPGRLPYMLALPLGLLLPGFRQVLAKGEAGAAGFFQWLLLAYFLGAALLAFLCVPGRLKTLARIVSLAALASAFAWSAMGGGPALSLWIVLFFFLMGGCAGVSAFAFVYCLNSRERLLGAALVSAVFMVSRLVNQWGWLPTAFMAPQFALFTLLITAAFFHFKGDAAEPAPAAPGKDDSKALLSMAFIFFAHNLMLLLHDNMPGIPGTQALYLEGLAGLGCALLAAFMAWRGLRGIWYLCSFYFIAMLASFLLFFLRGSLGTAALSHFLHGAEQLGFVTSFYLFGLVVFSSCSFRCFRLVWLAALGTSALANFLLARMSKEAPNAYTVLSGVLVFALFALYFMLLPVLSKALFTKEKVIPASSPLMETQALPLDRDTARSAYFDSKALSAREHQIALLLLKGETARQCAAELHLSEETVRYHIKHIYAKLGISGRAELFALVDKL